MIRVGVIGLGMMGHTHLDVYAKRDDVEVIAVSDLNPDRLSGKEKAGGNVEGQAKGGLDIASVQRKYDQGDKLIADADVDLVDICTPTPYHAECAIAALEAGKHVLIEKPVVRTTDQLGPLIDAVNKAKGVAMVAMCMRFWPGWTWLKDAVDNKTFGRVLAASFHRLTSHPAGQFYRDGQANGGAALDLHIHDTDFVQYLFGPPKGVTSAGYAKPTDAVDHISTRYHYDDVPLVTAEGGWALAEGFGFSMRYMVNFENATAVFEIAESEPLTLIEPGKGPVKVPLEPGMGYDHEIAYLLDCISSGQSPDRVTVTDAGAAVGIVEAEIQSVKSGQTVWL